MAVRRPRVSIGMPIYGGEQYLSSSIQSVLDQTFQDWELILLDDCSPDRSIDVIHTFQDDRLRLLRNTHNEGLVSARNRIMDESRGEFLAWLDQDDLAYKNRIATQVLFLDRNPHVSICGSFTETLVQQAGIPSRMRLEVFPKSHRQIRTAMVFLNPMACNTVTMRLKDVRERSFRFRPEFGNSLDYDMWSQASECLLFQNIPRPLGAYRVHPHQTSRGAALELMHQHAIRVQVELIERSLRIPVSAAERTLHASATIAPLNISSTEHLMEIASWFASLRQANLRHRTFDVDSFDETLVRQWTTCLLAARPTMDQASFARAAVRGAMRIHPKVRPAIGSLASGVRRRRIQRTRPALPSTDF